MSLLLAYHDQRRGLIVSDDLQIGFDAAGNPKPVAERCPKFILAGDVAFGIVGRSDICEATKAMVSTMDHLKVEAIAAMLRARWNARRELLDAPLDHDVVEAMMLGYENAANRIRCFVFTSSNDFASVETTSVASNRIVALGAYDAHDRPKLDALTKKMQQAHMKGWGWLAHSLGSTIADFHHDHPLRVGLPSYYAGIGRNGLVDLAEEFPRPEREVLSHVSIVKEEAIYGAGRMFVGSITTPAQGAPDTVGNNDGGAGAQSGSGPKFFMQIPTTSQSGDAAISNPAYAVSGSLVDYCQLGVTGDTASNTAQITAGFAPGIVTGQYSSIAVNIDYEVSHNTLAGSPAEPVATVQIGSLAGIVYATQTYNAGVTAGRQTLSATLPNGTNFSLITATVQLTTGAGAGPFATSGLLIIQVYDLSIQTYT